MGCLDVVATTDRTFAERWAKLRGRLSLEAELLDNRQRAEQVRRIIDQVRQGRDEAVARLTAEYDGVTLKPSDFRIPADSLAEAHGIIDAKLLDALRRSIENVRSYQQQIKMGQQSLKRWNGTDGVRFGELVRPLRRVGVCVPGASAPLVSTVVMTVVPAQVAGVGQIAVISAPGFNGSIHPAILATCHELGINEVYRVSGAQGVAALAFGTEAIAKVDKIVGPGNWWVQLAKKQVYGLVDIDSFAGPSEVLIVADASAKAGWVAAEMLSQAEHAPGSAVLATDSAELAANVADELEGQLNRLDRAKQTRQCIEDYCLAIVTKDMDEAIELANEFAPEHLQVQCADSESVAQKILQRGGNAGAVFVGGYTPVAVGDYFAGPSHTLPTGGSARFFSPLSVNDFFKRSSIVSYTRQALMDAAKPIITIAEAEGLDAHAKSVSIRTDA